MVLPKLQEMSSTLIDAAKDLGASNFNVLTKVILPYITPGIFAGFFMALTYSLDDFAVTFFVTGNGFSTLSVEIYSMARQGVSLTINALSTILFLFTILLVIGYYFISKRNGRIIGLGQENEKLVQTFAVIFIVSFALMFWVQRLNASEGYAGGDTITVYNWGEYIDPDLIKQFEKETGIKVIYETFDSNEAMMVKIRQGERHTM